MSQQVVSGSSPMSAVFLMHIALEIPIAIQGLWSPLGLPFLELNNTAVVMIKLYAAMSLATCVVAFLCYPLPEFLPGKRALAIAFVLYHCLVSTILIQSPRFIPYSFGTWFESLKLTPEVVWGSAHGLEAMAIVTWWQMTVGQTSAMRKYQ